MANLLPKAFAPWGLLLTMTLNAAEPVVVFDADHPLDWQIVNDTVMGGVSRSQVGRESDGHLIFTGHVSLENNGGFASVRSAPSTLGLAGTTALQVRLRGDGKRYKLTARTDDGFDGPNYQAAISTQAGEWQTVEVPMTTFVPSFRGRRVTGAPPLAGERIRSLGFLISDQQAGPFRLEVASIAGIVRPAKAPESP